MPRVVDPTERELDLRAAASEVIAEHGVAGFTIRRVASALGRSTSAVTHYSADREELLTRAVGGLLEDRRTEATQLIAVGDDPLWALIDWSVQADANGVWQPLVAAAIADVEPVVTQLVASFEAWWFEVLLDLVSDRVAPGLTAADATGAISVVVDGLLLAVDAATWTEPERRRITRLLVQPLLAP